MHRSKGLTKDPLLRDTLAQLQIELDLGRSIGLQGCLVSDAEDCAELRSCHGKVFLYGG